MLFLKPTIKHMNCQYFHKEECFLLRTIPVSKCFGDSKPKNTKMQNRARHFLAKIFLLKEAFYEQGGTLV